MTDSEHVDPTDDHDLHEQIREIHEVVGHFFKSSLEEFEFGLMRNAKPESHVALWSGVAAAWIAYHEEYLDDQVLSDADEKRLISALIAIAAGVDDVSKLGVPQKSDNDCWSVTKGWRKSESPLHGFAQTTI